MIITIKAPPFSAVSGAGAGVGREKSTQEELSIPILLADRLKKAASDADSFKSECSELATLAERIAAALRSVVRRLSSLPSSVGPPYTAPIRRIAAAATSALGRALALACRCRRRRRSPSALLNRLLLAFTATGTADFRRAIGFLDASLADLRWLLDLYPSSSPDGLGDDAAAFSLSLPPVASTDPILSYVWSWIAAVQMSPRPSERSEAAECLANLALDSDRSKWAIVEEGGVRPLLALLKESDDEASQIAATDALANLAASWDLVDHILGALAVPVVVQTLSNGSSMMLQTRLAVLIARMAAVHPVAQEEFARENAIRPLVSLLSFEVFVGEVNASMQFKKKPTSVHSLALLNRELAASSQLTKSSQLYTSNGSGSKNPRREWENESREVKHSLKVACSEALWRLSQGSISISHKITESKGLLVISKLIETEKGELKRNCLLTIMEIAAVAEAHAELRSSAFKKNSPEAKSVVEQLLRVVKEERSPSLHIVAIRSIGSLARKFPAREAGVLRPLVQQLWDWNPDVHSEAAIALGKFASPENYICVEHSKAIVEFEGVEPLMRLLRPGEKSQFPALVLLCYLAVNVPGHEALKSFNVLTTLQSISRSPVAQDPSLKDLIAKAIYQLELYHSGTHARIIIN